MGDSGEIRHILGTFKSPPTPSASIGGRSWAPVAHAPVAVTGPGGPGDLSLTGEIIRQNSPYPEVSLLRHSIGPIGGNIAARYLY